MKWSSQAWLVLLVSLFVGCNSRPDDAIETAQGHAVGPLDAGNDGAVVSPSTETGILADEDPNDQNPPNAPPAAASSDEGSLFDAAVGAHPDVDPAPPVEADADSGAAPSCDGELHFVSLYQSTPTSGSGAGSVNVHIERSGSHVLVLSAYESIRWTVSAAPGASLERIILNGYEAQEVVAQENVPVEFYDYEANNNALFDTAYTWNMAFGLGNASAPVAVLEGETGRPLTTFAGCYDASHITLHEDSTVSIDCDEGLPSLHVNPPCTAASLDFLDSETTNESVAFLPDASADAWCWMLEPRDYGTLVLHQIDPADGTAFELAHFESEEPQPSSSFSTSGLALLDGRLIFAGYMGNDNQWAQIDLGTQRLTIGGSSHHIDSVTTNGSELIAPCDEHHSALCTFDGFVALAQGRPSRIVQTGLLEGTSFTARGDVVYSARFSGSEVFVHDLQTGDLLTTIPLEGFDDWNHGIALTSDRLYLAASRTGSPACIVTFDPETGAQLNHVCVAGEPFASWSGLWCDGHARD